MKGNKHVCWQTAYRRQVRNKRQCNYRNNVHFVTIRGTNDDKKCIFPSPCTHQRRLRVCCINRMPTLSLVSFWSNFKLCQEQRTAYRDYGVGHGRIVYTADCPNERGIKFIQGKTDWICNKKSKHISLFSWHTVPLSHVLELESRHVATVTINR